MKLKYFARCQIIVLFLFSFSSISQQQLKAEIIKREVTKELFIEANLSIRENSFLVSPDYRKIAYIIDFGRTHVVLNKEKQKGYENVKNLVFSPDSKRLAYAAKEGNRWFAVVDGKEERSEPGYEGISEVTFSPDSKRLAYIAKQYRYSFLVVDGEERGGYDDIEKGSLVFSSDSKRIAYVAKQVTMMNEIVISSRSFVVVDRTEMLIYDEIDNLAFSPDSKKLVYRARRGNKWFVVIDQQEGEKFDEVKRNSIVFAPDNKTIAYQGKQMDQWFFIVTDGQTKDIYGGYDYIKVSTSPFSFDGKKFTYAAGKQQRLSLGEVKEEWSFFVVQNRQIQIYTGYEDVRLSSTAFSPDGTRFAFAAKSSNKWFLVTDGKENDKKYDEIRDFSIFFSSDSKRLAFIAKLFYTDYAQKLFSRWCVVTDGEESTKYEDIKSESLVFSPDNKHLAYVAISLGQAFVVLDGTEGERFDSIIGNKIIFDTPETFCYFAQSSNQDIYFVEERLVAQK